ncbi:MAG: 5'/3'-nucleotidase SurE [Planctomycetes bacterium]|nr:5'/3'-nucleotidase SurE [Planctomycetota bacterium]
MHILLTNDDGIFAPGIAALYKQLVKIGDVTVVAPADVMSGAGHSITVYEPLTCDEVDIAGAFGGYSVHGSPADCVKLALMELCEKKVDLIVSGINSGANVGINVYYSGTVAAAMEGAFYRIPAVAMSLAKDGTGWDFDEGSRQACRVLKKLLPLESGAVANINIPKLSGKVKGIKVVPQSTKGFEEHYIRQQITGGKVVYQLNGGEHRDIDSSVDTLALVEGFITVTALSFDMTDHSGMKKLEKIKF